MLLTFLRWRRKTCVMKRSRTEGERPDLVAAARGGDTSQAMDGEVELRGASIEEALYWRQIYAEILAMEEKVMERVHDLMASQTAVVRREVELTNVPVIAAQVDRFRQRLGFWTSRLRELESTE